MAPKIFQTSRPDKNKDRVAWNSSWEEDLKSVYQAMEPYAADPSTPTNSKASNRQKLAASMRQHVVLHEERVTRDMCELQDDLVRMALERMSSDDFEEKWKELTRKRREELVLEGLCRACSVGPDMEGHRKWCPDMTIENLAGNRGQGYIDLLKKLIPDEAGVKITKPTMIPHSIVERYYKKAEGSTPPEIQKYRAYFIILTLWYILLAFYGGSEEWKMYKPVREPSSPATREAVATVLGGDWERQVRRMKHEFKDDKIKFGAVNICWSCGKDPSKLEPGQELKVCAKCKAIGRTIWYCSKECQTHDWKQGTPRPHKAFCGKEVADDPVTVDAKLQTKKPVQKIPRPDPGFKRSPALLHQISLLQRKPAAGGSDPDYVLMNPPPHPDVGVALDADLRERQMFLIMRNRAFKCGEKRAVRFMYQKLLEGQSPTSKHYPVSRLKKQFEREYRVLDLDSGDINVDPPTKEEWDMAKELLPGA